MTNRIPTVEEATLIVSAIVNEIYRDDPNGVPKIEEVHCYKDRVTYKLEFTIKMENEL